MVDVKCKACGKMIGKFIVCIGAIKCPRKRCAKIFEYRVTSNMHMNNSEDPIETIKMLKSMNASN